MAEMFEAAPNRGDVRYYKLGGAMIQRPNGLDLVHDDLENIGVSVWDGERDVARVGGGAPDEGLEAEIVVLTPLEEYETQRVRRMGATIVEIPPESSHLHRRYLAQ